MSSRSPVTFRAASKASVCSSARVQFAMPICIDFSDFASIGASWGYPLYAKSIVRQGALQVRAVDFLVVMLVAKIISNVVFN